MYSVLVVDSAGESSLSRIYSSDLAIVDQQYPVAIQNIAWNQNDGYTHRITMVFLSHSANVNVLINHIYFQNVFAIYVQEKHHQSC